MSSHVESAEVHPETCLPCDVHLHTTISIFRHPDAAKDPSPSFRHCRSQFRVMATLREVIGRHPGTVPVLLEAHPKTPSHWHVPLQSCQHRGSSSQRHADTWQVLLKICCHCGTTFEDTLTMSHLSAAIDTAKFLSSMPPPLKSI